MTLSWLSWTLFATAAWQALAACAAARRGGRPPAAASWAMWLALLGVSGSLCWALLHDDFSLRYVAQHSQRALPGHYKLAAFWSGHQGSLLLWLLCLSVVAALPARPWPRAITALCQALLAGLLATVADPLATIAPAPADGQSLNPMLQHPLLALHPPLLYLGYACTVPLYTWALACCIGDTPNWQTCRRWALAAWCALGAGIAVGSLWTQQELGWGGWWFWDPVENAALLPWLCLSVLLHLRALAERSGALCALAMLLALLILPLVWLSVFLVRAGVLSSVHAFASDPLRAYALLAALLLSLLPALTQWPRWHAPPSRLQQGDYPLAAALLLMLVAATTLLLGTLYPLLLQVLTLGRISVGAPYFNSTVLPLLALALCGLGWARHGQRASRPQLAAATLLGALLAGRWLGWQAPAIAGGALCGGLLLASLPASNTLAAWARSVAHAGCGVLAVGIAAGSLASSHQLLLAPGQEVRWGDYALRLERISEWRGPHYLALRGELQLRHGQQRLATLRPEKRLYPGQAQASSEAGSYFSPSAELQVVLGDWQGPSPWQGQWSLRVHARPLLSAVWLGMAMLLAGGVMALIQAGRRR